VAQLTEVSSVGTAPDVAQHQRASLSGRVVQALRGRPGLTTGLLLLPGTLWMLLTVGTALVSIVVFSFWTSGFTGLRPEYTLANYQSLLRPDSSFWGITIWTLQVVAMLLIGVVLLAYPVAYALWRVIKSPYWQSALLLLFIVPFWTSYLTRTITWLPMFGREGVVNQVLTGLRITDEPVEFLLYSEFSMMVALWFLFIVFMVGPIYFSMQRVDEDIMSAAAVYGANPLKTFFLVVVPLTLPGLMAGSLFVVVLGLAEFFTERAIGGAQSPMLAGLIQRQIDVFQFAGASAIAVVLILITMVLVGLMLRFFDIRRI
jgi:putative spermidine/putrescine transport system permease protein